MPGHARPFHFLQEKAKILLHFFEVQRLIVNDRVHTETTGIGAAQAAEHRHDLNDRCLLKKPFNIFPPLTYTGQ
jgi:hypothetical protein